MSLIAFHITDDQLATTLSGVFTKKDEVTNYLTTFDDIHDKPAAHQDCCDYHRARWEGASTMKKALTRQLDQINDIIDVLLAAHPQADNTP